MAFGKNCAMLAATFEFGESPRFAAAMAAAIAACWAAATAAAFLKIMK